MDVKARLLDYVKEQSAGDSFFKGYIENQQCGLLYEYYREQKLNRISFAVEIERKRQAATHQYLYEEARRIFDFAHENNLRIVGLKGLFLESEYYNPRKEVRFYQDLDLMVKEEDIFALSEYFINTSGYSLIKPGQNIERYRHKSGKNMKITNFRKYQKKNHLFLMKKIDVEQMSCTNRLLNIEVHTDFNFIFETAFDHRAMLSNSIKKTTEDFIYYSFNPVDQLLYLCFHAAKHLPYVFLYPGPLFVDLQRIYDIALVAEQSQINWEYVAQTAQQYHVLPHVSFILKLASAIYPEIFPSEMIQKMRSQVEQNFSWYRIYQRMMELPSHKMISGNFEDIPEIVVAYEDVIRRFGPFDDRGKHAGRKRRAWERAMKPLL